MLIELPIRRVRSEILGTNCWCHFAVFSLVHHYLKNCGAPLPQKHLAASSLGQEPPQYDVFVQNMLAFSKLCENFGLHEKTYFVQKASEVVPDVSNIGVEEAREKVRESLSGRTPCIVWSMTVDSHWGEDAIHPHALVIYGTRTESDMVLVHDPNGIPTEISGGADYEHPLTDLFEDVQLCISYLTTFRKDPRDGLAMIRNWTRKIRVELV